MSDLHKVDQYLVEGSRKAESRTFYRGSRITTGFFDQNIVLRKSYPSSESIDTALKNLVDKTTNGYISVLEITENGLSEIIDAEQFG